MKWQLWGGLTECCGLKRRHFLPAKQRFFMQVFRPPLQTTWVFFICANLGHKRSSLVFFPQTCECSMADFTPKEPMPFPFSGFLQIAICFVSIFPFVCETKIISIGCLSTQAIIKSSDQVEGCLSQSFFFCLWDRQQMKQSLLLS